MTRATVADWDTNPDNNTDVSGINIAEGCPAQNINNAMRAIMAQIAAFYASLVSTFSATAANIWALATNAKIVTPQSLGAAAAPVALSDAASIAVDLSTGINFKVVLGGNRTIANFANAVPGTSGFIVVQQDATGGRTIAFDTNFVVMGTGVTAINGTANAYNMVSYVVVAANLALVFVNRS